MSRTRHYYYLHFPYRETETWRGRICGLDPLDFLPYHDCLMDMLWCRVLGLPQEVTCGWEVYLHLGQITPNPLISPPASSPQPISSDLKNCRVR